LADNIAVILLGFEQLLTNKNFISTLAQVENSLLRQTVHSNMLQLYHRQFRRYFRQQFFSTISLQ